MNPKHATIIALTALFLGWVPIELQAQPAKPSPRLSVRVLDKAELNTFFKAVCSADASNVSAQPEDGFLMELSSVEAECSTACCAHCTRCANTGEIDDCDYCDRKCAASELE